MRTLPVAAVLLVLSAEAAIATETRHWVVDTAEDFLKGRGEGVAVTREGRLLRTAPWRAGVAFDEPVLVAGLRMSDGSVIVGTGHPARLYRLTGDRKELLTAVPGEQVTALLASGDDELLVASVPPGVLYRWRKHTLDEVARVGEGAIWDLARFGDTVVAATGSPAILYRLAARGLERWVELPDSHARCLYPTADALLVGTSGKGLILSVLPSGQPTLLADSPFTEISDLVAVPDGSVWATALVGEPAQPAAVGGEGKDKASVATETGTADLELPKVNGTTATSELLRLTPEGALLSVQRFAKQVASALAWDGDGVVVGTGYEGEVWRFVDGGGTRLSTVDAIQVVAVLDGGELVLTQGPAQLLWRGTASEGEGSYRIDALRLERPARLGEYRLAPAGSGARIRFRSGASEKPDDTWMPWTNWLTAERAAVPLPPVRSLQWEVELAGAATVERVEVAYREVNLAPRVSSVAVEEPGVVYLAAPPPSGPVIERENPDVSGIFTVIDERAEGEGQAKTAKGKKFWRVGYRTVSWQVSDPNEDPLRFRLSIERDDSFLVLVRDQVEATQLAIDTTALPDGSYRFRLVASDEPDNPSDPLTGEGTTRWFIIDNTPPRILLERDDDRWRVTVSDDLSAVERVEWSRDGDRWHALAPADGVVDGLVERFDFAAQGGRHLVVVRAVDHHHNRATSSAVEE